MKNTAKKTLAILLSLVLMLGLMPGMSLTAYAADTYKITFTADNGNTTTREVTLSHKFSCNYYSENGELDLIIQALYGLTNGYCNVYNVPSSNSTSTSVTAGKIGNDHYITVNAPFEGTATVEGQYYSYFMGDYFTYTLDITCQAVSAAPTTVAVTGITLDKTSATLTVGGTETLTATVSPDNATDKKVKWSVGGTDASAVKLYSDADCTTEVGTDATSTLTVYAKGISAGSATVTATSNADSSKTASCAVTVNAADNTVNWTAADIKNATGDAFTINGVTLAAGNYVNHNIPSIWGGGTFTTTLGNFTKIEISADYAGEVTGTGWSNDEGQSATWTGNAASVSFSGDIWGGGMTSPLKCPPSPSRA